MYISSAQSVYRIEFIIIFIPEILCTCFPSVLRHCWSSDRKGIQPVKSWLLVCWWWRFDWSFARLIAPVVTITFCACAHTMNCCVHAFQFRVTETDRRMCRLTTWTMSLTLTAHRAVPTPGGHSDVAVQPSSELRGCATLETRATWIPSFRFSGLSAHFFIILRFFTVVHCHYDCCSDWLTYC